MSTRKVDPIPIAIAGVALVLGIGVLVYVLVFSSPTDAAPGDTVANVAAIEPVVPQVVDMAIRPDQDPEPEPVMPTEPLPVDPISVDPMPVDLVSVDPMPIDPRQVDSILVPPDEPYVPPQPIPPGERFELVPGSGLEERWLAAEGEIPPAANDHLERAEKTIRATQTVDKRKLAALDNEYRRLINGGLDSRKRAAIQNRFDKQADPLKRQIRDWSLEELHRPQPLHPRDLKVGRVGTLPRMTVLAIPDDQIVYVQFDEVAPVGVDPEGENLGGVNPAGPYAGDEGFYGPGSVVERDVGGRGIVDPGPIAPNFVVGGVRVLLRDVPREELVVGGIVRESRPFRVVGLAVDRSPGPGDPAGVRVPVLAPYDRYDDVAAHAEAYMVRIKQ